MVPRGHRRYLLSDAVDLTHLVSLRQRVIHLAVGAEIRRSLADDTVKIRGLVVSKVAIFSRSLDRTFLQKCSGLQVIRTHALTLSITRSQRVRFSLTSKVISAYTGAKLSYQSTLLRASRPYFSSARSPYLHQQTRLVCRTSNIVASRP